MWRAMTVNSANGTSGLYLECRCVHCVHGKPQVPCLPEHILTGARSRSSMALLSRFWGCFALQVHLQRWHPCEIETDLCNYKTLKLVQFTSRWSPVSLDCRALPSEMEAIYQLCARLGDGDSMGCINGGSVLLHRFNDSSHGGPQLFRL